MNLLVIPTISAHKSATETTSVSTTAQFTSPRTSLKQAALLRDGKLLEINSLVPSKYSSILSSNNLVSNGSVNIATPIDPLFVILPALEKAAEKLSPWDQIESVLEGEGVLPEKVVTEQMLSKICTTSDVMGDDMLLFKFSSEKTLSWLSAKYERVYALLKQRSEKRKEMWVGGRNETSGAFDATFTLAAGEGGAKSAFAAPTSTVVAVSPESNQKTGAAKDDKIKKIALQMVCEYLTTSWGSRLCKHLEYADESILSNKMKTKASASKGKENDSLTPWADDQVSDENNMAQYTLGKKGATIDDIKKEKEKQIEDDKKKDAQKRKLEKINTKGMKSLASFFGGAAKKPKK